MTGDVVVHAHLRTVTTGAADEQEPDHWHVQVEAPTYNAGRDRILADLPVGWIVASWRVE